VSLIRVGIDFDCSPRLVGALDALYGHRGFEFIHMEKLVAAPTEDEIWADILRRYGGRVVLSGNSKIAYKPHQAAAFIDNGLISFFPNGEWNRLKGHMRNAVMIEAWPRIEEKIASESAGSCWRIEFGYSRGELKLSGQPLTKLEIPSNVLDAARRRQAG
jgi:hypothetical protein